MDYPNILILKTYHIRLEDSQHLLHFRNNAYVFFHIFLGPTNEFTRGFLGFSIYISNTTKKTDGILCFKDENYTANTIPEVFHTTCPYHGQYVIYYNERLDGVSYPREYSNFAYNDLCEVEVEGTYQT